MHIVATSVTDVARNFSDYLNRAYYGGEHFLLFRGGKAIAEINPAPKNKTMRELPELLNSLPRLSKEESDEFIAEVQHARDSLKNEEDNPWDV
jgi:antitoxin (DNA-binding transcriptional repressor) of toxin-antitoxin stability system